MTKIEQIKKRIAAIEERRAEIVTLTQPLRKQLKPYDDEDYRLRIENVQLGVNLDEAAFKPSLEYFLSVTHDKFHDEANNPKCSYNKMHKHMADNYKHVVIRGYNQKTNIYAIELKIQSGANIDEVVKEVAPAIKLATKAGQEEFHLFTDDLSESGVLSLKIENGEYLIGKTSWSKYREHARFKSLKEALKYCLEHKLTYSRS